MPSGQIIHKCTAVFFHIRMEILELKSEKTPIEPSETDLPFWEINIEILRLSIVRQVSNKVIVY